MRNEYNSYLVLQNSNKLLTRLSKEKTWAELAVSVDSTLSAQSESKSLGYKFVFRNLDKNTLRSLAIISWYLPKNVQFLLQLDLRQKVRQQKLIEVEFILTSKGHVNVFLAKELESKGPEHLFGNILNIKLFERSVKSLKFKIQNCNLGPQIPEKRRIGVGYRDKGSLPDLAMGGGLGEITDTAKQNQIELNRKIQEDTFLFLKGMIE